MTATAVALPRNSPTMKNPLGRTELLSRYRQLREIGKRHHSAMLELLPKQAIMSQARRLGLVQGKTLVLDSVDDMNLVFDLLFYTAALNRPRAIDRFVRSTQFLPGSEERHVVEAMQQARFAIITCLRRHPTVGLVVKDLFRDAEYWLVDEGLECSLPVGATFATRLYTIDDFTMTAGVMVPVDLDLLEAVFADCPRLLRKERDQVIDDRRLAEGLYRVAIAEGLLEYISFQDTMPDVN